MKKERTRNYVIMQTGFIGIGTNLGLVALKAIVGLLANSISIILDAVNNLSDALSSLITIIGTKLANRAPDKKHPLGHGRIEYITAMIIAAIIIAAGVTSMIESINKIITPSDTNYSVISIVLISIAVVAKIILGLFTYRRGKKYQSDALTGSGKDALFDALISFSTIIGIIVALTAGVNIDGYLGILISIFILKAGLEMLFSTFSNILGKRIDKELSHRIKKELVNAFDEVYGVYDLYLDNFGPEKLIGSLHVEIDQNLTAEEIDKLSRKIAGFCYEKYQIIVTVGIYAINTTDKELVKLRSDISNAILRLDGVLQVHGFNIDKENNVVSLDVVRDFKFKDIELLQKQAYQAAKELYPQYEFYIIIDLDYSD